MIDISVNNAIHTFNDNTNIKEALGILGYVDQEMLGIAVNKTFIAKDLWSKISLRHKDHIDILNPISGG